jgi:excisionase family DNA binding protein
MVTSPQELTMSTIQKPSNSTAQIIQFERLLDSDEAASLLKIHPKTLQKLARKGEIIGVQIGKLWRFRASVLNDWLERKLAG